MYKTSTSACPHDCPSTCVLEIKHDKNNIYKVKGNKFNTYTKGVICSKVSRYPQRTHNKKRLTQPMMRVGKKGDGKFKNIEEKPSYSALINTGLYLFKSSVLNLIPKNRKFDINDLIEISKKKRKKIGLFPISDESWIDIGQWNEYRLAAKKLEE